ncbi:hypothetical protein C0992_004788 [Termitomyces sp. T32_za158]|nr:hypothetical protein C0992_004788 [Termitomyces sp. T32_za158]
MGHHIQCSCDYEESLQAAIPMVAAQDLEVNPKTLSDRAREKHHSHQRGFEKQQLLSAEQEEVLLAWAEKASISGKPLDTSDHDYNDKVPETSEVETSSSSAANISSILDNCQTLPSIAQDQRKSSPELLSDIQYLRIQMKACQDKILGLEAELAASNAQCMLMGSKRTKSAIDLDPLGDRTGMMVRGLRVDRYAKKYLVQYLNHHHHHHVEGYLGQISQSTKKSNHIPNIACCAFTIYMSGLPSLGTTVLQGLVFGLVTLFVYHYAHRHLRSRPPGPRGYPIIGNVLDLQRSREGDSIAKLGKTYGQL